MTVSTTATNWRPASAEEQSLWLLEQCFPGTGANNIAFAVRLDGPVQRDVLAEAAIHVVNEHRALHTRFRADGVGLAASTVPAVPAELSIESVPARGATAAETFAQFACRPFPLAGELLVRIAHARLGAADVLAFVVHHLVFDAMSMITFSTGLADAYNAIMRDGYAQSTLEPPAAEPPAPPQDSAYWSEYLAGFEPSRIRLDLASPDREGDPLAGAQQAHELSPEAVAAVRDLSRRLRSPDSSVLLAAFYLLLARHGADPDLVAGVAISTRDAVRSQAIGYHVNVLPMRVEVDRAVGFGELTGRVRRNFFEVMAHNGPGLESRLPRLPGALSWRSPLFRNAFNYVSAASIGELQFGDLEAHEEHLPTPYSKFDLEFFVTASPAGFALRAVYSTDLYHPADVSALLARYEALLLAAAADTDAPVGQLSLLTQADREVLDRAVIRVQDAFGQQLPPGVLGVEAGTGEPTRLGHDGSVEHPKPLEQPAAPAPGGSTAASAELITQLTAVWAQALRRDDVDADSNFFDFGGNSLLGAMLAQAVEDLIGVPVPLTAVFEHPSPAQLAGYLAASVPETEES